MTALNTGTASAPNFSGFSSSDTPAGLNTLLTSGPQATTTFLGGTFVDIDNDNDLDFVHAIYTSPSTPGFKTYENKGSWTFVDMASSNPLAGKFYSDWETGSVAFRERSAGVFDVALSDEGTDQLITGTWTVATQTLTWGIGFTRGGSELSYVGCLDHVMSRAVHMADIGNDGKVDVILMCPRKDASSSGRSRVIQLFENGPGTVLMAADDLQTFWGGVLGVNPRTSFALADVDAGAWVGGDVPVVVAVGLVARLIVWLVD